MESYIIDRVQERIDKFIEKVSTDYKIDLDSLKSLYSDCQMGTNDPKNKDDKDNRIDISRIRLGLCCINTILRESKPPVFCSRNLIRRTFTLEKAKLLALQNIKDLRKMIEWNVANGISLLRISSDLFPRFTDLEIERYTIDFARPLLKEVGEYIRSVGHRVLMHPGQYNQVGANTQKVFDSTVMDLGHHADILDALGCGPEGVIIVHGGGVYGDKPTTIKRWIKQFDNLPENVKKRLVLENCEKCYSPRDCVDICKKVGIPMVYDCHHYECYRLLHPDEQVEDICITIDDILSTWKLENGEYRCNPIMHISEQGEGRVGNHSDYISEIPQYMIDWTHKYNVYIDLEVEAKMKEQAIFRLYKKYGNKFA